MWGTRFGDRAYSVEERFIPTHVGNTFDNTPDFKRLAVHPHACGEHLALSPAHSLYVGSSPRMWGTPLIKAKEARK